VVNIKGLEKWRESWAVTPQGNKKETWTLFGTRVLLRHDKLQNKKRKSYSEGKPLSVCTF
jgi:hypothetical protein